MRAALLLALLVAPLALAQEQPAQPASFLVYRHLDGRDALATALAPPPFDAARLPATRIDRESVASPAPENRPESAPAHYREMLRLVQSSEQEGSPIRIGLDGDVAPGTLSIAINASLDSDEVFENAMAQAVGFEHGVLVGGRPHPYVARFALDPAPITIPGHASFDVRLDPAWDVDRLGVVAMILLDGRVVQTATWLPRQEEPTEQVARAPLVEHVTASWCTTCTPADEAFLLLATQRGAAGPLGGEGHASYLREPTGWLWAGLAMGSIAAIALVGRRRA